MKSTHCCFVACLIALFAVAGSAFANTTFSTQTGTATVNSFNFGTTGTLVNPWLADITFTSDLPTTFLLNETGNSGGGSAVGLGDNTGAGAAFTAGKWFLFTIHDASGLTFTSVDFELQSVLGTPSTNGDGLSFCQGNANCNNPTSPQYPTVNQIVDPRDFINFSGGSVASGSQFTTSFAVTDSGANAKIYLDIDPNRVVGAAVPEPGTLWTWGIGLGLLGVGKIRKVKFGARGGARNN